MIVQVPAVRSVTVVLATVQTVGVVEVNAIARPELAVAFSGRGVPTTCPPGLLKVMICAITCTSPAPATVTALLLLAWSVAVSETLSAPPEVGVKLIAEANAEPPLRVDWQLPVVLAVAVAVALAPATKFTAGAGVEEQPPSFRIVVTGFRVAEGLTAVPTGEDGALSASKVS